MEIVIHTKDRKTVQKAQHYLNIVQEQIYSEIESNPNLLGTKYFQEEDVYKDAITRVNDLLAMEREADKMRGNFLDRLNYKIYSKTRSRR